ncbi:MAG: hypothetical protein K9L56_14745 [Clostridiales bacterium]|nr:hypothetical protein [Clostridiales bacterium]
MTKWFKIIMKITEFLAGIIINLFGIFTMIMAVYSGTQQLMTGNEVIKYFIFGGLTHLFGLFLISCVLMSIIKK